MTQETDWNAVADAAHREWVDSEREDKIVELEAEIARLRAEADALREGIAKALDELDDDGPKAVKYAAQELRAAMGADA